MSNQGQAQEPTMEEILASIRRIISEDSGPDDSPRAAESAPPPAPDDEAYDIEEDILELTEALPEEPPYQEPASFEPPSSALVDDVQFAEPEPAPIPEPVAAVEPEPEPEPVYEPEPIYTPEPEPVVARVEPTPVAPEPVTPVQPAIEEPVMHTEPAQPSPSLISREAEAAASAAFGMLQTSLASSNSGRTLEDIVVDMLRPMLKEWLDDNLPSLVERLVAEEIERIARRRG